MGYYLFEQISRLTDTEYIFESKGTAIYFYEGLSVELKKSEHA